MFLRGLAISCVLLIALAITPPWSLGQDADSDVIVSDRGAGSVPTYSAPTNPVPTNPAPTYSAQPKTTNSGSLVGRTISQIGESTKATYSKTKDFLTPKPISVPKIQMPTLNMPAVKVPTLNMPKMKMPEMSMPKISMPRWQMPSFASGRPAQPQTQQTSSFLSPSTWKLPSFNGGSQRKPERVALTPQEYMSLPIETR